MLPLLTLDLLRGEGGERNWGVRGFKRTHQGLLLFLLLKHARQGKYVFTTKIKMARLLKGTWILLPRSSYSKEGIFKGLSTPPWVFNKEHIRTGFSLF